MAASASLLPMMAMLLGPIMLAAMIVGTVIAASAQTGGLIAPSAIKPDWSRLNPVNGFKRLFSALRGPSRRSRAS
jgi:flagellar biosynthesis protein FlhB